MVQIYFNPLLTVCTYEGHGTNLPCYCWHLIVLIYVFKKYRFSRDRTATQ